MYTTTYLFGKFRTAVINLANFSGTRAKALHFIMYESNDLPLDFLQEETLRSSLPDNCIMYLDNINSILNKLEVRIVKARRMNNRLNMPMTILHLRSNAQLLIENICNIAFELQKNL